MTGGFIDATGGETRPNQKRPSEACRNQRWMRIAHRGASAYAPENTLAAFRKALEMGTDAVEIDVHLTADGEVVVLHDATLNRTTTGKGAVRELTFEEVRKADAGVKFREDFAGERVPTFREALEVVGNEAIAVVEIKAFDVTLPAAKIVREMDRLDQIVVISFLPESLKLLREQDADIPISLLVGMTFAVDPVQNALAMLRQAQQVGTSSVDIQYPMATPEAVRAIHRRGGSVWVWTVDDPADIAAMDAARVDAITSNYPDRLS